MRKPTALITTLAVVAGLAFAAPGISPASALSPGVEFSAENLPTWQADGVVYALAAASGGKVVAGGTFNKLRPPTGGSGTVVNRSALAILNSETGAPDSCVLNVAYSAGTPTVRSLVASPDGNTVYVGGNFTSIGGVNVTRVAAIDPTNCSVKAFRPATAASTVYGMALSGNSLYLAGAFVSVGGQPRAKFAALNATTGALLPWIANTGLTNRASTVTADGRALTVSPDGTKVVVGGEFDTINGADSHSIAVVDGATGAIVRNYPSPFIHRDSVTKTLYSDGTRFYGGNEGTGGGVFDGRFAIDWSSLDQTWRDTCLGATQALIEHNGTLYAASHAHDCGSTNQFQDGKRNYFTAQGTENPALLGWFPRGNDGIGEGIGPRALTISAGRTTGKEFLWAAGEFTQINGSAQQSLTRFGPDDSGNPPTPIATAEALTNEAIQVRFRTVVDEDDSDLTYRVYRNGATAPIWEGTAKSLWWTRPQVTFVDTSVTAGSRYTYRVTASDGKNTSALSPTTAATAATKAVDYPAKVIADGAQLYWRYDETSGEWAQDAAAAATSTTANNGLYKEGAAGGAPGAVSGDDSASATFDGVDDYVWEDQLKVGTNTYSIETWIKTDTTAGGKIIGFGNGRPRTDNNNVALSGSYDRHVYMENDGRIAFGVYTGATTAVRSAASYNDNQWHHVVATQGATGMRLFIDGLSVGSNAVSNAQSYNGVWHVGGDNLNGWPNRPSSNYFRGQIDETAVYPAPLTARQIADHYVLGGGSPDVNASPTDTYGAAVFTDEPDVFWRLDETTGVAHDSSYFGQNDGTVGSDVQRGQTGRIGDGSAINTVGNTNSLVVAPQTGSPGAFTTEAWVKTTTTTGGKIIGFEAVPTGTGGSYDKQIYMANSGALVFGVYNGSVQVAQTTGTYNDGKWHHIVGTQDSNGLRLYVDGALRASNGATTNQVYTGYWRVGGGNMNSWPSASSSQYFTGTIDEVAVYSRGLGADEVAAHFAIGSNDSAAPTTPQGVTASVTGTSAEVAWSASSDDTGVSEYRVHRGATADFAVDAANLAATVTQLSYTDTSLPAGRYYYRVVAADAAGNASVASASVAAVVSDTAAPTTPADVTAAVSGSNVSVSWSASSDNVGVSGYAVHRGSAADFAVSESTRIATVSGTSYEDANVAPGTYYYRIVASDGDGNVSAASAGAGAVVQNPNDVPVVRTVTPTADAMVALNAPTTNYGSQNYLSSRSGNAENQSFLAFDIPAAPAGKVLTGASLQVRTSTSSTAASVDSHRVRLLSGSWNESTVTWNTRPTGLGGTLGTLNGAASLNTEYPIALNASTLSPSAGGPVSLAIVGDGTDNLRLWSSEAPAGYSPVLTLTYTTGSATPPPADTTAPSTPQGAVASVAGTTVSLTWSASTDDRGVAQYRIFRGATVDFVANDGTAVGVASGTSFTDAGLAPGTYYYRVAAADGAGNASPASASARATVTDPSTAPVVVEVTPTADTLVAQNNSTANYGSATYLVSRGGNAENQVYLAFDIPAAPAGKTLTGATLRVRTSTDSAATSIDTFTLRVLTGAWDESTVSWNTRPTGLGQKLGTVAGFRAPNTFYTVDLDAEVLASLVGSSVSTAILGGGTDNVRLWSSEAAVASRPVLTLTYTS